MHVLVETIPLIVYKNLITWTWQRRKKYSGPAANAPSIDNDADARWNFTLFEKFAGRRTACPLAAHVPSYGPSVDAANNAHYCSWTQHHATPDVHSTTLQSTRTMSTRACFNIAPHYCYTIQYYIPHIFPIVNANEKWKPFLLLCETNYVCVATFQFYSQLNTLSLL